MNGERYLLDTHAVVSILPARADLDTCAFLAFGSGCHRAVDFTPSTEAVEKGLYVFGGYSVAHASFSLSVSMGAGVRP